MADKKISIGDIYTRLVKCLYKKYTIRTHIAYKLDDFNKVMKSVGKLALQTLMCNKPLFQRCEVLRIAGHFAFDYGLFAGHEDFRLLGDPTADLYVTYPHRSLEKFFCSFGFLQALDDEKSVDDILGSDCQKPIFMVDPLVLSFCLWFLSRSDFKFLQRGECYSKLTSYVTERIDSTVFDSDIIGLRFSAIDMSSPPGQFDRSQIQFFRDILSKCNHMKSVNVDERFFEHVFDLTDTDFTNRMTKIVIDRDLFKLKFDRNSVKLSIDAHFVDDALQMRNLLLCKYSKELCISYTSCTLLAASGEIPDCPILTHLTFHGVHIGQSVPSALRKAILNGKLPSLRSVTLVKCCQQTLSSEWPDEIEVSVKHDIHTGVDLECWICSYGIKF